MTTICTPGITVLSGDSAAPAAAADDDDDTLYHSL